MNDASATPKPYHHGDLRQALLAAAESELAEVGIERFSIRSVAKRAGVSHAAPAHHFRDAAGLLTALAAEGFRRFLQTQRARQAEAAAQPHEQIVAAGLGYIDFALAYPALFHLMFISSRPEWSDATLNAAASAAYEYLEAGVAALREKGASPASEASDVAAAWAIVHGLAALIQADRLKMLQGLSRASRDAVLAGIIRRFLPDAPGT
jgi:AcrR family transcriptional regulator